MSMHGARVFLFTEMFRFLLVVLIHVTKNKNKSKKQKTKPPKQTQKTSAQTVIYDKKRAAEKGVSCLFNAGQSFSGEDDLPTSSGRAFSDRRKKACG